MLCPRRDFYEKSGDGGLRYDEIIYTTSSLYARVQHDAPKSAACISVSRFKGKTYLSCFFFKSFILWFP